MVVLRISAKYIAEVWFVVEMKVCVLCVGFVCYIRR